MLPSAGRAGRCDSLSALSFPLLAAAEFARLLVALLQFQALEEAVVLNFFLQNSHCFFDVIVDDPDFDFLQLYRPFRPAGTPRGGVRQLFEKKIISLCQKTGHRLFTGI